VTPAASSPRTAGLEDENVGLKERLAHAHQEREFLRAKLRAVSTPLHTVAPND